MLWIERRPDEAGRQVLVGASLRSGPRDRVARDVDVRSRVHEYGGGDYLASPRGLFFVHDGRPGLQWVTDGEARQVAGSDTPARYAEPAVSPDGRFLVAVEEWPQQGAEPVNRLVSFELGGGGRRVLAEGHDFFSSVCFSPDGRRLAWLAWDHPHMPWDAATLFEAEWSGDTGGRAAAAHWVAGGPDESVFQPGYSPAGRLTWVSDRDGWWNLFQRRGDAPVAVSPCEAELGRPQWAFGMRSWSFVDEAAVVCTISQDGRDRLALLHVETGAVEDLPTTSCAIDGLACEAGRVAFIGASAREAPAVRCLDLGTRTEHVLRPAFQVELDPAWISEAEAVAFPSAEGRTAHAFLYRPRSPVTRPPAGERAPLLVKAHGGPTGASSAALDLGIQFWTSRGFAVLDVNYTGSSGFGRAYRDALQGAWGVADVDDCVAGARFVADAGAADPARLSIRGGSAGGYTVLCALTFRDAFAAGASHYGIADLEALARDTHKFEARYLDGLVGPWPERRDLYEARSPIHHVEGLACPVIFFQGSEDRVVPPAQSEAMVDALARRGLPHAYLLFEGEGHGFRRAESIRAALEAELYFYGRVLGFPTAPTPPVPLAGQLP